MMSEKAKLLPDGPLPVEGRGTAPRYGAAFGQRCFFAFFSEEYCAFTALR